MGDALHESLVNIGRIFRYLVGFDPFKLILLTINNILSILEFLIVSIVNKNFATLPKTKSTIMKNLLILSSAILLMASCNQPTVECPEIDMSAYEKNKSTLETMFSNFQQGIVDSTMYASDFIDVGTGFNESDKGKDEAIENYNMMTSLLKMNLQNAIYLPGIDTTNFEVDGSVRYYGEWQMQMGEATQKLKTYGSIEFNEAGEIKNIAHYGDWTATFNALLAENPEIMETMSQAAEAAESAVPAE